MCHPAGWNGNEDDLTGFYAEQIYLLTEASQHFTEPDCIDRMAEVIKIMVTACRRFSVDPKAAVPYDVARFGRWLHERFNGTGNTGLDDSMTEAYDAVMADWGAPTGPGHDSHGHGKTPDGWKCLSE
jgi:hypothetical protein